MNNQTNGRESQAVGAPFPYGNPWLAPSHIGPSTERSNGIFSENHSTVHQIHRPSAPTTQEHSSAVVSPQSLIVPTTEDQDLQLLLMADLSTTYDVSNPYLDQPPLHIGNSIERSNEIFGGVSENHFMDVGATSQVCNIYSNQLSLHIGDSNKRSNEIFGGVSENHFVDIGSTSNFYNPYYDPLPLQFGQLDEQLSEIAAGCRIGQSHQNDYPTGAMIEPSSEVVAPLNSTVLAIENGQSSSICQPIMPFYPQIMASMLAFPGVGCSPSTSCHPLDREFCQDNIVRFEPFDGSSTSITNLQKYYLMDDPKRILENGGEPRDNINIRYQEVDRGKKIQKPNNGRRHCSCKKSKCIQRYCECFYSEFFCDDMCGCQGCNNIIELGTLVSKKRAEMKRKNPLAFYPKIVPLQPEDSELHGIRLPGQNKRHKRGCSCNKSKCLQNYCECYQANVKCSIGCRCKGCGNMDTREHDAGSTNFMTEEAVNHNDNTHGFRSNGGKMIPQAEASNNIIGPQAQMSSISPVNPLHQWPPRESTSFDNSISSYQTFRPQIFPPMNFYEFSPNHNGTPLMLNESHFSARANSPDRKRIPPPRFPVPEAGSGMSTPSLPPLIQPPFIPSNDADKRSNGQCDAEKNSIV